jgi:AcrR family transcriptional regulator
MSESEKAADQIAPPRPRGRPRAEEREARESELIGVARRCFIANGYGATSMAEVARAARVSKRTLYARFPSKADLFRAILDAQIQQTGGGVPLRGPKPRTLEATLCIYAERTLQESLSSEILQLNRLIYSEAGRFPELGDAAWARGQVGVRQVAEHIREHALKDGVPTRDPEAAAALFIDILRGRYSGMMLRSQPVTTAEITAWTREMVQLFLASRPSW